jgi:pseudoazurin
MAALIGAAHAEDYRVGELNAGPGGAFVFDPAIVRLAVGDTVTFVAVDQFHQVTTVIGGIPAGAEPFRSERNMDYTQAFTVPGIYVYECTSHRSLGMVGIVIVGDDVSNLDAVRGLDLGAPLANERLAAMVAEIGG